MKIDFHVHTNRSIDAVPSPRLVVKHAKKLGLNAIAITDHNRLFPHHEAQRLSREFGLLVIPGMEGGNIAVRKHWIALGVSRPFESHSIDTVLSFIRHEGGVSVAPHPHARLGYANYADLGFDAVESLNGSEPLANTLVRNTKNMPELGGSDAHALPMMGHTWTRVEADGTLDSVLEAVRSGRCTPSGTTVPFLDFLRFYPLYVRHRILGEPREAISRACRVIREIRALGTGESSCTAVEYPRIQGEQHPSP
ncbi:PHP domain-containing protein [Methanoregula sp.]|jgi:PHP domain|uniref:PHP domain-containing protein n=1 Tax=Methanoregula sp. TaxID=2052170 RepID=UPI003C27F8B4